MAAAAADPNAKSALAAPKRQRAVQFTESADRVRETTTEYSASQTQGNPRAERAFWQGRRRSNLRKSAANATSVPSAAAATTEEAEAAAGAEAEVHAAVAVAKANSQAAAAARV